LATRGRTDRSECRKKVSSRSGVAGITGSALASLAADLDGVGQQALGAILRQAEVDFSKIGGALAGILLGHLHPVAGQAFFRE